MQSNFDIYLIGFSVLIFLTILFFFIRKISSSNNLKVKIEPVTDSFEIKEFDDVKLETQKSFDFEEQEFVSDQELVILNLISMDKSSFDIDQLFGFMNNSKARLVHGFFSFKGSSNKEVFRVANALNPGTFEENTKTFAILMAADLNNVEDPLSAVREMVAFAYNFSEKFYANICDSERLPITKQMISHIESKAQEVMRLRQLKKFDQ
jgi:FtsZ-interacting cell division protein ZipA